MLIPVVTGVQYEGETLEQMAERDRRTEELWQHFRAVQDFYAAERARPWWIDRTQPAPQPPAWAVQA